MNTDLDFYTHRLCEARRAAAAARDAGERRAQERLAGAYALQVQRLGHTPTLVTPDRLRLRPLAIAA